MRRIETILDAHAFPKLVVALPCDECGKTGTDKMILTKQDGITIKKILCPECWIKTMKNILKDTPFMADEQGGL